MDSQRYAVYSHRGRQLDVEELFQRIDWKSVTRSRTIVQWSFTRRREHIYLPHG